MSKLRPLAVNNVALLAPLRSVQFSSGWIFKVRMDIVSVRVDYWPVLFSPPCLRLQVSSGSGREACGTYNDIVFIWNSATGVTGPIYELWVRSIDIEHTHRAYTSSIHIEHTHRAYTSSIHIEHTHRAYTSSIHIDVDIRDGSFRRGDSCDNHSCTGWCRGHR